MKKEAQEDLQLCNIKCAGAGSFTLPDQTVKLLNPEVLSDTRVAVWRATWLPSAGVAVLPAFFYSTNSLMDSSMRKVERLRNSTEKSVFDGIKPEELEAPEEPDPWWRRPFVIVIGIFLLVLIFSLSFQDAIMGIIQSKSLHNQELIFRNTTILFEGDTLQQLQDEFVSNEHREIKACLFGKAESGLYIVSKVEFPDIIRANVVHIVSVPCPINTLIDLHSHPINQCLASEQDISVYNNAKESNPQLRMMVMCSSTRFALV